jgi:hypothetical protein
MGTPSKERQAKFKSRMREKGYRQLHVWVPREVLETLNAELKIRRKGDQSWNMSRLVTLLLKRGMERMEK